MEETLPVSVIILTKNSAKTLQKCLESIIRNKPSEIIIIDGYSKDQTINIASKFTNKIFFDEGKGKTFARQLGAELSNMNYICYVDSDVVLVNNDALKIMLRTLCHSNKAGIGARPWLKAKFKNYWSKAFHEHRAMALEHLSTYAGIFKKEIILKYKFDISGYAFGLMDDLDLEIRLRKDGLRFGFADVFYFYCNDSSFKDYICMFFLYGRLLPFYIKKYGCCNPRFWPICMLIYRLVYCIIKLKVLLIPYFFVYSFVQQLGMIKGFIDLLKKHQNK